MYNSIVEKRGYVTFPEFLGERIYMHEFMQSDGLPEKYSRWQSTVDDMLKNIHTDHPIYLMVDQTYVQKGQPQRRPGLHVDGYWVVNEGIACHRGGGHRGSISAHGGGGHNGGGNDYNDNGHNGNGYDHHSPVQRHSAGNSGWDNIDFSMPEGIILASDIAACAAYSGKYDEHLIGNGGDASKIRNNFDRIALERNQVYAGNVGFLHESLPVTEDCYRTLVRLNVPGWSPTIN